MSEDLIITSRVTYLSSLTCLIIFILAPRLFAAPLINNQVTAAVTPKPITMMSYNIQQLGYPNWAGNHFEEQRLELIPSTLKALSKQPDVLILQEVFTEHAFEVLVSQMSQTYPYYTQVAGDDCDDPRWTSISGNCKASFFKGNSGVLIFSRWPIVQQHAYVFDAVRVSKSFDFLARKGVVYAKIHVEREKPMTLHVFGTHLQASVEEHDIRLLQLAEMRRFIDDFQIPLQEPVILGGDFNIRSTDTSRFNELLAHAVAKVTLPQAGVGSMSDATNGYRRLLAGADSKVRADTTLDYLLLRSDHLQPVNNPKLKVVELKSKTPWRGARVFGPDVELTDLSDHYPVMIELEF